MAKQRRRIITAGRYCRAVQYAATREPDVQRSRAPKELISSPARESLNLQQSWQKFKACLAANFGYSDLVVTLTYSDDRLPKRKPESAARVKSFIRDLRVERRKRGLDGLLPYMVVTEGWHGDHRIHEHIILPADVCDISVLKKLWKKNGTLDIKRVADKGYDGWARYLTKEPREHGRPSVGERMWRAARGLKKPESDSCWVNADDHLTAPPGAIILDNQTRDNVYGTFHYLEYLLPQKNK